MPAAGVRVLTAASREHFSHLLKYSRHPSEDARKMRIFSKTPAARAVSSVTPRTLNNWLAVSESFQPYNTAGQEIPFHGLTAVQSSLAKAERQVSQDKEQLEEAEKDLERQRRQNELLREQLLAATKVCICAAKLAEGRESCCAKGAGGLRAKRARWRRVYAYETAMFGRRPV